jgi:hypothetical protein
VTLFFLSMRMLLLPSHGNHPLVPHTWTSTKPHCEGLLPVHSS